MEICGRKIGPGHSPYIVAEISGEHRGSVTRGEQLINAAHEAGADAVKFQLYAPESLTHESMTETIKSGPWAGKTLFELYSETQTSKGLLGHFFEYAKELGITAFASVFDLDGVDYLESLNVGCYKIASFELNDLPLIQKASSTKKPLIISTGMGSETDIKFAMDTYARYGKPEDLALLHCVSEYPALPSEANLPALGPLSDLRGGHHVVGLSDHTLGVGVSVAAVALGASIIEKHLTLDRSDAGPDGGFSLEPSEFQSLVKSCRDAWQAVQSSAYPSSRRYSQYRRGLVVVAELAPGDSFSKENVRSLRHATGLPPKFYEHVLKGVATCHLSPGTALRPEMVSTLGQI